MTPEEMSEHKMRRKVTGYHGQTSSPTMCAGNSDSALRTHCWIQVEDRIDQCALCGMTREAVKIEITPNLDRMQREAIRNAEIAGWLQAGTLFILGFGAVAFVAYMLFTHNLF